MVTPRPPKKDTVAIVGLGLIGASLAAALGRHYHVAGCSLRREEEQYALAHGYIEEVRPVERLAGVDCVVICTPLSVLRQTAQEVYRAVGDTAVITDVGSVKGILRDCPGRVVGGHPMAGTEQSGIEAAKEHLFENAYYCIVPYERSREDDVSYVTALARAVRSKPVVLDCAAHDALAARFSHMPHLVAYALSGMSGDDGLPLAGSGYMDCTRIAASSPAFWTEVFRLNRDNTLSQLRAFRSELTELETLLTEEQYPALQEKLRAAQERRIRLAEARASENDYAVSVDVRDEPGAVQKVTALLKERGINLAGIRILSSREGVGGVLRLELSTRKDTAAARAALAAAGYAVY